MSGAPRTALLVGILLAAAALAGCEAATQQVRSLADLRAGEAMLVGRIEVVTLPSASGPSTPRSVIAPGESRLAEIVMGKQVVLIHPDRPAARVEDVTRVTIGQTFYLRAPAGTFYINAIRVAVVPAPLRTAMNDWVWLPSRIAVDVPARSRAIYIGTFRYTVDRFFNVLNAEIADDHAEENRAFALKFGEQTPLVRSLAREPTPGQRQKADQQGHTSTDGIASLEFLESRKLPGIEALTNR